MQNDQFIWGLVGNKEIEKYSIAPFMWKKLFEKKRMNIKYVIIGSNSFLKVKKTLEKYLENQNFIGVNIALPWKNLGFQLCDEIEDIAKNVETINTLIKKNKKIMGYNTDGIGITESIKNIVEIKNKNIFLIGAGSSAQTMPYYLIKEGAKKIFIYDIFFSKSKDLKRKYLNISKEYSTYLEILNHEKNIPIKLRETDILINSSSCGMKGSQQKYPFDENYLENIHPSCVCAEAVYTPYITSLLSYVQNNSNRVCPGIKMLVEQAAESFFRGFGRKLDLEDKLFMENIARETLNDS